MNWNISSALLGAARFLGLTLLGFLPTAASPLTLSWDASTSTPAGYYIYYGPLNSAAQKVDAGNATSYTFNNLSSGTTYYFYATAYAAGLESTPSEQVTFTMPVELIDSDGDGLPDAFEVANGLNPNNSADATLDWDGDGLNSLQEFWAGTNPQDSANAFRIVNAKDESTGFKIQFNAVSGKTYTLEANNDFPNGSWQSVASLSATAALMERVDTGSAAVAKRIYRITTTGSSGETIATEFAGYQKFSLLGNSDTILSIPFTRPAASAGAVSAVSGSTIEVRGVALWTANQWVYSSGVQSNTYYAIFTGGAREGDYFTITANGQNTLTIDLKGGSLAGVNAGDPVAIVPYWTIGTIFEGGKGIHASLSPLSRSTEVLLPDVDGTGVNLSATSTYYYWSGAWRRVGAGSAIRNDDVILPDMYFTVRHNISTSSEVTTYGSVHHATWRIALTRNAASKQDNIVALPRPHAVSLNSSGLIQSGAFRTSASPLSRADELLVFDNSFATKNRSPSATYYHWSGAWRRLGAGSADFGSEAVFTPGAGFIIRAAPGSTSATWSNTPAF
jgi:uncharacterized protein (TIGR02597 family)